MGTLHITEYSNIAVVNGAVTQIPQEPAVAEQAVTTNASTSTASAAFNTETRIVRLICAEDVHVKFSAAATATAATTAMQKIEADVTEWRGVSPGHVVTAIDAA